MGIDRMIFSTSYTFQRGETIAVALDLPDGGLDVVQSITARLRFIQGAGDLKRCDPVGDELTVTYYTADGDTPEGWLISMAADDSFYLSVGRYVLDARIVMIDESVVITEPCLVYINEPADAGDAL